MKSDQRQMGDIAPEPCMLCGSKDFDLRKKVTWQVTGFDDVDLRFGLCRNCGHICQNPVLPDNVLTALYEDFSNYTVVDKTWKPPSEPNFLSKRFCDLAEKHIPGKGRCFEIGCATGKHLYYLQKQGWQVSGCDPSPLAVEQAKIYYDIAIMPEFAEAALADQDAFDLILLSHVLEHVPSPETLLGLIRTALEKDGKAIVEVPLAHRDDLIPNGWLTFEHLSYFSQASLVRLAQAAGFEILDTVIDNDQYIFPTITVVLAKTNDKFEPISDSNLYEVNNRFLTNYIARERGIWESMRGKFAPVSSAYVWASGIHTSQLFSETSVLTDVNIVGIVDNNPSKQGKQQFGHRILSADDFRARYRGEHIIISSYYSQEAIYRQLCSMDIDVQKIVRLYDDRTTE